MLAGQSRIQVAAELENAARQAHEFQDNGVRPDLRDIAPYSEEPLEEVAAMTQMNDLEDNDPPIADQLILPEDIFEDGASSGELSVPGRDDFEDDRDDEDRDDEDEDDRDYHSDDEYDDDDDDLDAEEEGLDELEVATSRNRVSKARGSSTKKTTKAEQRLAIRAIITSRAQELGKDGESSRAEVGDLGLKRKFAAGNEDGGGTGMAATGGRYPDTSKRSRGPSLEGMGGLRANWKKNKNVLPIVGDWDHSTTTSSNARHVPASVRDNPHPTEDASTQGQPRTTQATRQATPIAQVRSQVPGPAHRTPTARMGTPIAQAQSSNLLERENTSSRTTAQMGIIHRDPQPGTQIDGVNPTKGRSKKGRSDRDDDTSEAKYTNADLPFPQGQHRKGLKIWQKEVLPSFYEWAGSIDSTFGSNSHPEFTAKIQALWSQQFPDLAGSAEHPAISTVAGSALRNWRSNFGKKASEVVANHLQGMSIEEIAAFVATMLPTDDICPFLYRFPDNPKGEREAWTSDLILETFARAHLSVTIGHTSDASPVAAMALSAVAVERALEAWESGQFSRKSKFSDTVWGTKAESYGISANNISVERWEIIMDLATPFVDLKEGVTVPIHDRTLYVMDQRANIVD
ncbi:hypothetical protein ONZ45_g6612 [Pleurotus djamor]|nr:hypothetical protein ONZ45_g6612 [Pleurotus djamor]